MDNSTGMFYGVQSRYKFQTNDGFGSEICTLTWYMNELNKIIKVNIKLYKSKLLLKII